MDTVDEEEKKSPNRLIRIGKVYVSEKKNDLN